MKILLISDLHVFSKIGPGEEPPSYFAVKKASTAPLSSYDIKTEFFDALTKNDIQCDYVICCGDIVHKADEEGYNEAWAFVHDVKNRVNATDAIITAGNHDVDSKYQTSKGSPMEYLKTLNPGFPSNDEHEFNAYWARDFYIKETTDIRFIVINSSSAHGYKNEDEHGRLHDRALKEIQKYTRDVGSKPLNICISHHHPHRHSEHSLGDLDDLKNGQTLLDHLGTAGCGQWLFLHGHKHHPRLNYAQGSSFSPIVFAAGSFSARLYPELRNFARNQFYLLNIDIPTIINSRKLLGEFTAWSWFATKGWQPANPEDGLPHIGGFGCRELWRLTHEMSNTLPKGKFEWAELVSQFPDLRYLIPQDRAHLLLENHTGQGARLIKI
jgi:predicted phosphodiesterase